MLKPKIEWTEKQLCWLRKHFQNTKNSEIVNELKKRGPEISMRTMIRMARKLGLEKTVNFINKVTRESLKAAHEHNIETGYEESRLYSKRMWEEYREKGTKPSSCFHPGETCLQRLGVKREAERLRKAHAKRNETIKKDRRRMELGLEQTTRLNLEKRYDRKEVNYRSRSKKKGYVIFKDDSIIYYSKDTDRSAIMEKGMKKNGITVLPLSLRGKNMNIAGDTMLVAGNMNY